MNKNLVINASPIILLGKADLLKTMTTHVVRLKVFRLKAEGTRKTRLPHFGGETADFYIKHGFNVCSIPAFPNSLQPSVYPPE